MVIVMAVVDPCPRNISCNSGAGGHSSGGRSGGRGIGGISTKILLL